MAYFFPMIDFQPFLVSGLLGIWVSIILFVLGLPLGLVFARATGFWMPWVEAFFSLPMVLAPTVLGFFLLVLLGSEGPLGRWFNDVWNLRLVFTFPGLVVGGVITGLPLVVSQFKTGFRGVDPRLWELSQSLGRGFWFTLFRGILPAMKSSLVAALVLGFAHTLGEFGVAMMVGGSIPGETKVVSIALYEMVEVSDYQGALVYAIILLGLGYLGMVVSFMAASWNKNPK